MRTTMTLCLAALLFSAAGCVPLTDYRKLEARFHDQEEYIEKHKNQVRELERREHALTLRAREQERQKELLRVRLQKSERLRRRLNERDTEPTAMPASTPKQEAPQVMGLEVNPESGGLVLESGLLFPPGRATLKTKGKAVLNRLVKELSADRYAGTTIRIEGHTDDSPIKRSRHKDNWDLSAKRALAVLSHLEKGGLAASRLSFAGYGPHKPFAKGNDARAKARNRRVEILVFE